ncbi:MAG TPA: serine/threonine-protein kinase [Gemmatimonadales bacterium]|nr:serine/threonine-protein kinase [Gemmatimonadales bacterium]
MAVDVGALQERLQRALGTEFKVGDLLGEGGYAAVFRAKDRAGRRDVAVKVLDLGLTPSPELAERFVREARTVAQLDHPHIVPIYRVGGFKNTILFIIMRCVDGMSLRQLLERRGELSVDDAVRVARQVADALAYAHQRHIIHRDIKPDNILLDASGHVLVTDFGIAKASEAASASQLTTEGMVVGTPHYMSPEQATGDRIDTRSDIYSLGIVLYQMLVGAVPFDGESAQAVLMKQATADPAPIRRRRREVPDKLARVLERMLAKDPAERFQTAEELSRAIIEARPAAAGDRIALRRRRSAEPRNRRTRMAAGLAGLVIVAALVLASVTALGRGPRLRVTAPVPDSVNSRLQQRGILSRTDTAVFAFSPYSEREALLVIALHRVAVAAPRHLRGYPREGLAYRFGTTWRGGPKIIFVLDPGSGAPDTVYGRLSPRDAWELERGVRVLLSRSTGR